MVYDYIRWEEKAIANAAKKRGVELKLLDAKDILLLLDDDYTKAFGDIVLQRCISYFRSLHLTAALEAKGISVVNPFNVALTTGNKLLTSLALLKAGIPTPRTALSFNPKGALKSVENFGYPSILKPTIGSWGRLVAPLKDKDSAEAIFEDREHMFPLYQVYYIQEYVKRPPRDIRSIVIGDEVVAAIYRVSPSGNWKTNIALGAKAVNCPITKELEDICIKASKIVGGGILGVDCMEGPDGLLVHEINNTTEFKNTVPSTGVDIPSLIIDYLKKSSR
ncbi:MAG: lysine biosynthesis protein LysX [Candidatus Methylarchaceae archaeon HK02M1]|nr:lysine biosynthesis protein LysX [Candidatus Methylarchaceae archaeon HK02M1]